MPVGWPAGDHHEADESAITGRTAPLPEYTDYGSGDPTILFGVPILTPERRKVIPIGVRFLPETLAQLRALA